MCVFRGVGVRATRRSTARVVVDESLRRRARNPFGSLRSAYFLLYSMSYFLVRLNAHLPSNAIVKSTNVCMLIDDEVEDAKWSAHATSSL